MPKDGGSPDGLASGCAATDDAGVWKLLEGDAYYAHRLRSETSTDISPREAHELGLLEVARIQSELREAFRAMGYPEELELADLVGRAVEEAGTLPMQTQAEKDAVIRAWETLIDDAEGRIGGAFELQPEAEVVVIGGSGGEFYEPR